MSLVLTNKLFKSPLGLIFECCGIARVVPIKIDKTKVCLDFHIFTVLDFDLLIGYPFEKIFQEKSSHGSLNEEFRKTTSATSISHPEIPIARCLPNQDLFEEVKFISLFVSPKLAYETECSSLSSLEPKPCPFWEQKLLCHAQFYCTNTGVQEEGFHLQA
jgi:hypothetical protein